jgi:Ca2+-binding RTX toxin-like protein
MPNFPSPQEDNIQDTPFNDEIDALAGNDRITVTGGYDFVSGNTGNDTLVIQGVNADQGVFNISGPKPNANLGGYDGVTQQVEGQVYYTSIENFVIYSGAGADEIQTGVGNDVVSTGLNDDRVDVGSGIDVADGGGDFDTISADLSASTRNVVFDLVSGSYSGPGHFSNFERFGTLRTGGGNDTIVTCRDVPGMSWGNSADETIFAGAGNDRVTTFNGDDWVHGGSGQDTLILKPTDMTALTISVSANATDGGYDGTAMDQSETVQFFSFEHFMVVGSSRDDTISLGNGDDVVLAGAGSDLVDVGAGNDNADGGSGETDPFEMDGIAADLSTLTTAVQWNLKTNAYSAERGKFTNFEYFANVRTGSGDDRISTGLENADDKLSTGAGADIVTVFNGHDTVDLGAGFDTLVVDFRHIEYQGVVTLVAPTGDLATGYAGSFEAGSAQVDFQNVERFVVYGADGDYRITTAGGDDFISTGNGGGWVYAGAGKDVIEAGGGHDFIDGGQGADTMYGGDGDDTYLIDNAADRMIETGWALGRDLAQASISYSLAGTYVDDLTLTGSAAINGTGNSGYNVITGNGAANVLDGRAGGDWLEGLGGDDTYIVDHVEDWAVEAAGGGYDTVRSSVSFTLHDEQELEKLVLTGNNGVSGTGNNIANRIIGNAAANVLDGAGGADRLAGGAGDDVYIVDMSADRVIEEAAGGIDTVQSSVDFALSANVERLVLTGWAEVGKGNALDNIITGSWTNNLLKGYEGDDRLIGNGGHDRLDGGTGMDKLVGGVGDDTYVIDDAGDRAIEMADEGTDTVQSSISYALAANVENLTLTGTAAVGKGNALANIVTGNDAANLLKGYEGDDRLVGGAGDDRLDGGAGMDKLLGGTGNDSYVVDDAGDRVAEAAGEGTDAVLSSVSYALAANVENLTLTGTAQAGKGNALANVLTGNAQQNLLKGYAGDDSLHGGRGNDSLWGGEGADGFFFDSKLSAGTNVDALLDFSAADDTIMLDTNVFTGIGMDGTLDAAAFVAGTAATDADDRILYDAATGRIFYDQDGSGDAAAVLFATVAAGTELTNADFVAYNAPPAGSIAAEAAWLGF